MVGMSHIKINSKKKLEPGFNYTLEVKNHPWYRLRLQSCCRGFESQKHHQHFFNLYIEIVMRKG